MILGNFSGIDLDNRINGYSFRKGGGGQICHFLSSFPSPTEINSLRKEFALRSVFFVPQFFKRNNLRYYLFASLEVIADVGAIFIKGNTYVTTCLLLRWGMSNED